MMKSDNAALEPILKLLKDAIAPKYDLSWSFRREQPGWQIDISEDYTGSLKYLSVCEGWFENGCMVWSYYGDVIMTLFDRLSDGGPNISKIQQFITDNPWITKFSGMPSYEELKLVLSIHGIV